MNGGLIQWLLLISIIANPQVVFVFFLAPILQCFVWNSKAMKSLGFIEEKKSGNSSKTLSKWLCNHHRVWSLLVCQPKCMQNHKHPHQYNGMNLKYYFKRWLRTFQEEFFCVAKWFYSFSVFECFWHCNVRTSFRKYFFATLAGLGNIVGTLFVACRI